MPKTKISEYSATANSNTDVASINIDEGCAPSGINNAIRAVMGHLKDFQAGTNSDSFNGPTNGAHNGTVGATTPAAGAFTTLSSTGNVTLGDASTDTLNVGNGGIVKDASGNVGIGTSSPSSKLHVAGQIEASTDTTTPSGGNAYFYKSSVGAIVSGYIAAIETGSAGSRVERMRIDASGNLGIGTSSPTGKVDIASTSTTQPVFRALNNGSNWAQMLCGYNGTSVNYYDADTQIFRNGATQAERARIDSSGNLLVGTTSFATPGFALNPSGYFFLGNNAQASGWAFATFQRSGTTVGTITQNGTTAVAYNTTSDYRLKENVQPIANALDRVAALKPCTYTWKSAPDEIGEGFIAHELQEVCPQAVTGEKDAVDEEGNAKYQSIDTSFLVATLTAAIQEQQALINAQQAALTTLTARITALEAK